MNLRNWLDENICDDTPDLGSVILQFAIGAQRLAARIAKGQNLSEAVGVNRSGDGQKALDLIANDIFIDFLKRASVRNCGSEEAESTITIKPDGAYDVVMDPLDGSGNIGQNVPVGTIFGVYRSSGTEPRTPGRELLAAGFLVYGATTEMVVSVGGAPALFTLTDYGFSMAHVKVEIPPRSKVIAANVSNQWRWAPAIADYVTERFEGGWNLRWTGSLVVEARRILTQGGLFLYPGDDRPGYADGRLRLVYEANPIGWLIEKAGGRATSGDIDILDIEPTDLHQHVPLIFGSSDDVSDLLHEIAHFGDRP